MLKCQNWNITLLILTPIQNKMSEHVQLHPLPHEPWLSKSLKNSSNSLAQIRCWGRIMASSPKYEDMQWKPRGGWISLTYTCSTYKAIREKYDDLLDSHYISLAYSNVHQEGWAQTCVPFFHLESFYCRVVITLLRMQSYTRWYVDLVPLINFGLLMDDKGEHMCVHCFHLESFYCRVVTPLLRTKLGIGNGSAQA